MNIFAKKETFRSDYENREDLHITDEDREERLFLTKTSYTIFDIPKILNIVYVCHMEKTSVYKKYKLERKHITKLTNFLSDNWYDNMEQYENLCKSCMSNKMSYDIEAPNNSGRLSNQFKKFKKFIGNRGEGDDNVILNETEKSKVRSTIFSILEIGWKPDILIVDTDYKVCAGQHRYMALRILQLPIQYVTDDTVTAEDCEKLNSCFAGFSSRDKIQSEVSKGNENHKRVKELLNKYKSRNFNLNVLGVVFTGKAYSKAVLSKPTFTLTQEDIDSYQYLLDYLCEIDDVVQDVHRKLVQEGELKSSVRGVGGKTDAFYEAIALIDRYMKIDKTLLKNAIHEFIGNVDYRARWSDIYSATATLDSVVGAYCKAHKVAKKDRPKILLNYIAYRDGKI